jgi:hypothetical protein
MNIIIKYKEIYLGYFKSLSKLGKVIYFISYFY